MAQDGDSSYHVRDRFRKELLVITVADILALPAFEQVQPLVLCEGAESREVHNVGILDCAPDKDGGYESYIPGEFIVTNLGFAHDDPELSERSLLVLIARGVSGIALKKAYRPIVSDRVRAASEAAGVPMYLYDGGYHEVVAYQALDLIGATASNPIRDASWTACFLGTIRMLPVRRCTSWRGRPDRPSNA